MAAYFRSHSNIANAVVSHRGSRQQSIDHHLQLLDLNRSILKTILEFEPVLDSSRPMLFHPDFYARNIFVAADDPAKITGIIDWQSTAIEPVYVYAAETPDFAEDLPLDEMLDAKS